MLAEICNNVDSLCTSGGSVNWKTAIKSSPVVSTNLGHFLPFNAAIQFYSLYTAELCTYVQQTMFAKMLAGEVF